MDDLRKERLVLSITTLAGISCILQNFFAGWDFWVPPVILVAVIVLWVFHVTQKVDMHLRMCMYFACAAFLVFYHGIHETSFYDISIAVALFMTTFTAANSTFILNISLVEYAVIMAVQFYYLYNNGTTETDAFTVTKIAFHMVTVFSLYMFCRITVARKITEKANMDEWMETVSDNNRDMEDFLSNISHELRTPVNVINGMTALERKNNDSKELLSIQEAGIRLTHQIEDIQDYTEIKRGELVLMEENYMCVSLINDVVANYKTVYRESDLELVIDLDPETPTMLRGDIQKLHKIFRHLLDNAMKFTHRGGVYIRVFPIQHDYGINLTIEVTDTGIGMTRADISRVSKGMYQANKKRNRSTGGIGIGLPIVYGFVHKMGGFVTINSEKKKGTTVRISIPQVVVDPVPSLLVKDQGSKDMIFYLKPEKFKVPEVRDFYSNMGINLAGKLKMRLYSASENREIEYLVKEHEIAYIFTGVEEYEGSRDLLDRLSNEGIKVIVTADRGFAPGSGSRVVVAPKPLYAFPIVRILNGEEDIEEYGEENGEKPLFTGVSALIVDDEPMNLVVATGLLREYRMFADTADSGKEAIRKYENGDYDIVFMDHMMPEMDGVEAMKRIKQVAMEKGKTAKVIALTANALSGAREMFKNEGFDGFIAKPIDIGEFERVMKNVLPDEITGSERRAGS